MAKGQVLEISTNKVLQYVIGNKEVINVKNMKKSKKLLISAKMTGYTDLQLFKKDEKKVISIYVLSKKDHFQILEAKQNLDQLSGIKSKVKSGRLILEGEIQSTEDFFIFKSLSKENNYLNTQKLKVGSAVKNKVLSKVYREFFDNYYDQIKCSFRSLNIICYTTPTIFKDKEFINRVKNEYGLKLHSSKTIWGQKNLKMEMRIFQIERLDGREIDFGLSEFNLSIADLVKGKFSSFREKLINLNSTKYNVSTLSTPRALMRYNEELVIKIGSEIPFVTSSINGSNTTWKFAGLKLRLTPFRLGNKANVSYTTELTRPIQVTGAQNLSINGSRQKSSVAVNLNESLQIFEIDLKTDDHRSNSMPYLSQIPILGNLFVSKSKSSTYKKIIAVLQIKEQS